MNLDRERIYLSCPRCNFYARPLARQYGSPPTRQPDAFAISTGGSPLVPKRVWTAGKPTNTIPPMTDCNKSIMRFVTRSGRKMTRRSDWKGKESPCLEMDCREAKTSSKLY
jgi:hypothetical protein